ncbi:MAG: hypothetical protein AB1540_08400 [Bdellovibrionota bacterium]
MRRFLTVALPAIFLLSGFGSCQNRCEIVFQFRDEMTLLQSEVEKVRSEPAFEEFCANYSATWDEKLADGTTMANEVADEEFTESHRSCARWGTRRHCTGVREGRECHTERKCKKWNEEVTFKEGYKEVKQLATRLNRLRFDLNKACESRSSDQTLDSYKHLAKAHIHFRLIDDDALVLLRQAGCYNRKGE